MLTRSLLALATVAATALAQTGPTIANFTGPRGYVVAGPSTARGCRSCGPFSRVPFSGLYDPDQGALYGYVFPPNTTGDEFIGQWVIPVANKWAGQSFGTGMVGNPLLMAWPYNSTVVHSTRSAGYWQYPTPYTGPIVTTLPQFTHANASHWTWVFHCKNCTSALLVSLCAALQLNLCAQRGPAAGRR
jgi:hypothetical protein